MECCVNRFRYDWSKNLFWFILLFYCFLWFWYSCIYSPLLVKHSKYRTLTDCKWFCYHMKSMNWNSESSGPFRFVYFFWRQELLTLACESEFAASIPLGLGCQISFPQAQINWVQCIQAAGFHQQRKHSGFEVCQLQLHCRFMFIWEGVGLHQGPKTCIHLHGGPMILSRTTALWT